MPEKQPKEIEPISDSSYSMKGKVNYNNYQKFNFGDFSDFL